MKKVDVFISKNTSANIYSGASITKIFRKLTTRSGRDVSEAVLKLIARLDCERLEGIIELTKQFDNFELNSKNIRVSKESIGKQAKKLDTKTKKAIDEAYKRVYRFQKRIAKTILKNVKEENSDGKTELIPRPISRIGIYVPGGLVPLPSSLMMAGVTARSAGVSRIIVCTPPKKEGLNPAVAYLLLKLRIYEVYLLGGVQAIWAMANGLEQYFSKVDKICGPGNAYVAEAKKQMAMQGKVGIDLIAGPSEVLIIADKTANPKYMAADMLAQAEHGPTSPGILITDSIKIAEETQKEIYLQLKKLKRANEIFRAIKEYGGILVVNSIGRAFELANLYASEHVELFISKDKLKSVRTKIPRGGAIFINTGESFADYGFTGGNHILPTSGTASFSSGLSILDFVVWQYVEELTGEGQRKLSEKAGSFADCEGLEAHAKAARLRNR